MLSFLASGICTVLDLLVAFPASLTTQALDYFDRVTKKTNLSEQDDTLAECRYRLDSENPLILTLPDSRKISYAIFGSTSPTAHTIFFVHGWPGSRIEATYLEKAAQSNNIRVVSLDRPGTGLSTPDPNRTILSHTEDIEHLADHLKAEQFGVFGVSGGGPYALACAKGLPAHRLKVLCIVCGLGPSDIGYWGMFPLNYLGWTYAPHYFPRLLRWWFSREPGARLDLALKERINMLIRGFEKAAPKMNPKDARFFGDIDGMKVYLRGARESNLQGTEWWLQDMKLLASDPGFRVEDIRKDLKVQLWYGKLDGNVPLKHGEEVARRLKTEAEIESEDESRVYLRIKDDDTHASIFFDYREEFLREMANMM